MSRLYAALFAVSCAFQAACATEPATEVGDLTAEQLAEGKVLYDTNGCAACHGPDGRGDGPLAPVLTPRPRDFASPAAFKGPRTMVAVAGVIARGIPSTPTPMPAYSHLDLASCRQLAGYVLSIGGGESRAPSSRR